jgi:hypothetical protein
MVAVDELGERLIMYILKVIGARRSVLAYHTCENSTELDELLAVYHALGYAPESLLVEKREKERAA